MPSLSDILHPMRYCEVYTVYNPRTKKQEQCGAPVGKYRAIEGEPVLGYMVTRVGAESGTPMCAEHASYAGTVVS